LAGGVASAGRLVRPFKLEVKASSSYYVVHLQSALRQKKVRAFRDCLLEEMATDRGRAV
jgi:LysR family glycine cleavage system transcriptional activator